jgi:hypothetical protein
MASLLRRTVPLQIDTDDAEPGAARVAAFAGAAELDEKEYQRQIAQLLEDP